MYRFGKDGMVGLGGEGNMVDLYEGGGKVMMCRRGEWKEK